MTVATQIPGDSKKPAVVRYRCSSISPRRKVYAATLGSSIGSAVAIIIVAFVCPALDKMGAGIKEERGELTTAITTIVTTSTTFMFGYIARPGRDDSSVEEPEE